MAKESIEHYSKYFFLASFLGIILLSIYLIKSYIITMVGAVLLSYVFYPIYKKINSKIKSKKLSSLFTTLLVVIIIIIPLIFAANALISESVQFFYSTGDLDLSSIEAATSERLGGDVEISKYITDNLN